MWIGEEKRMKIRMGFVANSSSSSFMIFYKKISSDVWRNICNTRTIPTELQGKLYSYDDSYLSEGVDRIKLTPAILKLIIENDKQYDFNFVEIVDTVYELQEAVITSDKIGSMICSYTMDRDCTDDDIEYFKARYIEE